MTREEIDKLSRYIANIDECLFPKGFTKDTVTVAIISNERKNFDRALQKVKSLGGRYDPVKKQWTIKRP